MRQRLKEERILRSILRLCLCGALLFSAANLFAQDDKPKDAEGCKDSPLITRFPGSIINSCDNKEYEQADLPTADGNAKHVEGEFHSWDYATREGTSEIQVFRNFEAAIKRAGFTIDNATAPMQLVGHKGKTWIYIDNRGSYYDQIIVTEKQMQQEVTADASSLSDEINKSGHVAVYGIHFDTGKAVIQPDSENVLGEIAKLLQENPGLKLRVEGHTDNQGSAAANQALSEKRAQAVVAWLVGHGVSAARLTAKGFGSTNPVADNSSDDGRAKNRRVELVKQ
jgi:outer membrane protein OmpA-like peptidoglycan-associated protein